MMVAMAITVPALARCVHRGCPWRWTSGADRDCGHHGGDYGLAERMTATGVDVTAAPAGRHDPAVMTDSDDGQ